MKVIPKRTFLLRQEEIREGKTKDVIARKGEAIEVSDKELRKFAADLVPVNGATSAKKK